MSREAPDKRDSGNPIQLPLPPGKVLVFDHIAGRVYVADVRVWVQRNA